MPRMAGMRGHRLGVLYGSLAALSAGKEPTTEPNQIWPSNLELNEELLGKYSEEVCQRSGSRSAAADKRLEDEIRTGADIGKAYALGAVGAGDTLASLLDIRRDAGLLPDALRKVARTCESDDMSSSAKPTEILSGGDCGGVWMSYMQEMVMPFAIPLVICFMGAVAHCIFCFVSCCRCCRKCICCREPPKDHHPNLFKLIFTLVVWLIASSGMVALGVSIQGLGFVLHENIDWQLCTVFQLADEAIYGADEMRFLGTNNTHSHLVEFASALDADGEVMRMSHQTLQLTEGFASRMARIRLRLSRFTATLRTIGPGIRIYDHRCIFCGLAVGDPQHSFLGMPPEGIAVALEQEIEESALAAMDGIRTSIVTEFTGAGLATLSSKVKRARDALYILSPALDSALVQFVPSKLPSLDALESLRVAGFGTVCGFALASAFFGWLAFFITHRRKKNAPDLFPSGKPHLCAWCCGCCGLTFSLLVGGILLLLAVSIGEGCVFLREDLVVYDGVNRYRKSLGLVVPEDQLWSEDAATAASVAAVNLARSCFTANGTGDMMGILGLVEPLAFQPNLTSAFFRLDEVVAESSAGRRTAELLDSLQEAAELYGSLFVLDPLPSEGTGGNLGELELNPNVRELLLGSALSPEDAESPDGMTLHAGLNMYAALIAGPGKYTFSRGTAGGGHVITPSSPSTSEMASLPPPVRNALLYARNKELLLASNSTLPCDTVDAAGNIVQRSCSVHGFHSYVVAEVAQLRADVDEAAREAALVQHLFSIELRGKLLPILRKARDLRTMSNCRFIWARIRSFDEALCSDIAPATAQIAASFLALAGATAVGILVQYKVWRHLKDNKVVGQEFERFQHACEAIAASMHHMEEARQAKEAAALND